MSYNNDISTFEARIAMRASKMLSNINILMRNLGRGIVRDLTESTPVDTGLAISNWQTSIGEPIHEPIEHYSKGSKGSTRAENIAGAVDQANVVIAGFVIGMGPIQIVNNIHYITELNDGTSSQAPINFVQMSVIRAVAVVQSEPPIITGVYIDVS